MKTRKAKKSQLQKRLQRLQKKLQRSNKIIQKCIEQLRKIWLCSIFLVPLISCGTTKVTVSKPTSGSYTTITVTTNNPISTDVKPETNATLWDKK